MRVKDVEVGLTDLNGKMSTLLQAKQRVVRELDSQIVELELLVAAYQKKCPHPESRWFHEEGKPTIICGVCKKVLR